MKRPDGTPFGNAVRNRRRQLNITQIALAEALTELFGSRVSQSYISAVETGRMLPTENRRKLWLAHLGLIHTHVETHTFRIKDEHP